MVLTQEMLIKEGVPKAQSAELIKKIYEGSVSSTQVRLESTVAEVQAKLPPIDDSGGFKSN